MPSNEKEQDLFGFNNDSEEENDLFLDEEQDSRFTKTKLQKGSLNDESDASSDEESEAEDQQEEESDNEQQESDNDQEESENDQQEESNDEAESDDQQDQLSDMEGYDAPDNLSDFGVISTGKNKKKKKIKALTPEELEKFEKARKKTGVCYLSRIPLFMPPSRVRELLKKYADIGRIYLVPEGIVMKTQDDALLIFI
ncbi:Putative U3 snoRNP-associated protein Esf2 [Rhizopus microsporus]|nr:Putative U3 snoRNP-associated protein Esf2 [Rhizopus microsporus]